MLDDCFGDPFVWSEGADHSDALASNDWILIKAPALRALAAREVGEGLREAINSFIRNADTRPPKYIASGHCILLAEKPDGPPVLRDRGASEEVITHVAHALNLFAALAAPAPFHGDEPSCSNCGHSYAQHTKGINHPQKYCRHCPCPEWAAPAPKPAPPAEPDTLFDEVAILIHNAIDHARYGIPYSEKMIAHWRDVESRFAVRHAAERKP